jgi:hypothetical protein
LKLHKNSYYAINFALFFRFCLAAAFGFLASSILFDLRLESPSSDIHRYLQLYDRYSAYIAERSSAFLDLFTNEVPFHFIYEKLSELLGDPDLALRSFSFLSAAIIMFFATAGNWVRKLSGVMILSHPLVLDLVSSQQRMALAIALFLFVSHVVQGGRASLITFILGTIHTYMAALSIFQAFFYFVVRFFPNKRILFLLLGVVVFAVSVTVLKDVILFLLGDRRAGAAETPTMGVNYALMWLGTYAAISALYPKLFLNVWGFMFLISAVATILGAITGVYSSRYAALSVIFISLLVQRMKIGTNFFIVLAVYFLNLVLSYAYWVTFSN